MERPTHWTKLEQKETEPNQRQIKIFDLGNERLIWLEWTAFHPEHAGERPRGNLDSPLAGKNPENNLFATQLAKWHHLSSAGGETH